MAVVSKKHSHLSVRVIGICRTELLVCLCVSACVCVCAHVKKYRSFIYILLSVPLLSMSSVFHSSVEVVWPGTASPFCRL